MSALCSACKERRSKRCLKEYMAGEVDRLQKLVTSTEKRIEKATNDDVTRSLRSALDRHSNALTTAREQLALFAAGCTQS